ncbi:hypothetical protein ACFX13_010412 [Malus domestica]
MIPYHILSKMRPYEVEVHGVKVTVSVVSGNARLIDEKILWLKSQQHSNRVLGIELKFSIIPLKPKMLLVCTDSRCLIIPRLDELLLRSYPTDVSQSGLGRLLSDRSDCFVGTNISSYVSCIGTSASAVTYMIKNTAVELGYLAAMVLKKPSLQKKGLYELAGEIGVDVKPLTGAFPDTNSEVFTEEEIKNAVHDVHASCLVANKPGNARLVDEKILWLKSQQQRNRVMGIELEFSMSIAKMFLVCTDSRCSIIPRLDELLNYSYRKDVSQSGLGRLLFDQSNCFVGMNISRYISCSSTSALTCMIQNTAVELGYLAAMVLKKPSLEKKGLYELADDIGVDVKPLTGAFPDLNSEVFSKEEIKNAVHDVYGSYLVGNKILGML